MPKLLVYCLPMSSKNLYLILNILDIVICMMIMGFIQINFISALNKIGSSMIIFLYFTLFISSSVALFVYVTRGSYKTRAHMVYMIVRLFISIISFLIMTMALFGAIKVLSAGTNNNLAPTLTWLSIMILYDTLSLFWSYQLMKIVN